MNVEPIYLYFCAFNALNIQTGMVFISTSNDKLFARIVANNKNYKKKSFQSIMI